MVDVFRARIAYKRCKTRHKDRENIIVPMTNKLKEAFRLLPVPFGSEGLLFPAWTATKYLGQWVEPLGNAGGNAGPPTNSEARRLVI
jgi:hypothetical protein